MKTHERIIKEFKSHIESMKDNVERNLIGAVAAKQITIDQKVLPGLLLIIKRSIDDSFEGGVRSLLRSIEGLIENDTKKDTEAKTASKKSK